MSTYILSLETENLFFLDSWLCVQFSKPLSAAWEWALGLEYFLIKKKIRSAHSLWRTYNLVWEMSLFQAQCVLLCSALSVCFLWQLANSMAISVPRREGMGSFVLWHNWSACRPACGCWPWATGTYYWGWSCCFFSMWVKCYSIQCLTTLSFPWWLQYQDTVGSSMQTSPNHKQYMLNAQHWFYAIFFRIYFVGNNNGIIQNKVRLLQNLAKNPRP